MKKLFVIVGLATIVCGCTSARISRDLSSGLVGCAAGDIEIVDEDATVSGTHTWIAVCNGQRFACGYQSTTGAHCKELMTQRSQSPAQGG